MRATATPRGIRLPASDSPRAQSTLNVEIAGRRVWSVEIPATRKRVLVPWPRSLRERLIGRAEVRLTDAATDEFVWQGEVRWRGPGAPDLTDARGRELAVNKWGLMRPTFEGDGTLRQRVADSAAEVLEVLQAAGYTSFVVGGTLLGAVRDGEILPHDDDADLAYLSKHSHPSDLIAENHELAELLSAKGYRVLRHSWSHLQVLTGTASEVDYYVDIFTAFYKFGHFHEPIHMRSPGMEDAITPLGAVSMHGHTFPAPHDPEAWLAACYGPHWRSPDPSFKFETPLATRRRFYSWFGSYNLGRNAWEDRYHDGLSGHESAAIRPHVLAAAGAAAAARSGSSRPTPDSLTPQLIQVLDIGAGSGEDAAHYRQAGLTCHTSDYTLAAPVLQEPAPFTGARVNLVERIDALRYLAGKMSGAEHTVIAANHVLAALGSVGLHSALQVLAAAARAGAHVITADYETLGDYHPELPRTWHLDWAEFEAAGAEVGLNCQLLQRVSVRDEDGVRRSVFVAELVSAGTDDAGAIESSVVSDAGDRKDLS